MDGGVRTTRRSSSRRSRGGWVYVCRGMLSAWPVHTCCCNTEQRITGGCYKGPCTKTLSFAAVPTSGTVVVTCDYPEYTTSVLHWLYPLTHTFAHTHAHPTTRTRTPYWFYTFTPNQYTLRVRTPIHTQHTPCGAPIHTQAWFQLHVVVGASNTPAVAHAIVEEAEILDATVVIVGSHLKSTLQELWSGSVSNTVASHLQRPCILVR